ncbi:ABC transporter permease [Microvirga sp. BT689]|uniref:ABC transporter permease n=1 Tax=Microvirga arvi TaxID=2778731 RepID=UPI0019520AEA|nr:ABC transporter permease [Microvirga arvi]MBM6583531.1 ABC transporter permease [Microvirga arvi]
MTRSFGDTILATGTRVGLRVFTGVVLAYLVLPILVVVPLSFTSGQLLVFPLPGLSLQWYADFFSNPLWTVALRNSVAIGLTTTALATTIGTMAALGLHNAKFRMKPLVMALLVTPLAAPVVIVAVAMFYFFATLNLVGTYAGVILAHTILALPFVVVTVSATLQSYDPNMTRAGASLGGSPIYVFRTITLPIIAPGIASGALFAFVTSFDEIVIALFVASPQQRTLPRQIFSGVSESISPTIMAAAVILLAVSLALMGVMELLRRRSERLTGGINKQR